MKRVKAPAFQLYVNDFITGTQTMTLAARGAYVTLLCQQWDKGAIRDDVAELARLLSCERAEICTIWDEVSSKFVRGSDGLFRNMRIEHERRKHREFQKKQAQNGKKGGRPRNNPSLSFGFRLAKPKHKAKKSSSSSSSSSKYPPKGSQREPDIWKQQEKTAEMRRLMALGMSKADAAQKVFG